jgi:hypothetical protein
MMRRRDALWALGAVGSAAALALGWPVRAQGSGSNAPAEVAQQSWGATRLQGQGRLRFLGLHVYDARLWVGEQAVGESDWAQRPLALELVYARRLVGKLIAERSLKEMQGLEAIEASAAQRWLAEMTRLFPDVNDGDRLTGIHRPGEGARFFLNGQLRGELRDAEFSRLFFGIWLSPKTSEPALRERLLGRG